MKTDLDPALQAFLQSLGSNLPEGMELTIRHGRMDAGLAKVLQRNGRESLPALNEARKAFRLGPIRSGYNVLELPEGDPAAFAEGRVAVVIITRPARGRQQVDWADKALGWDQRVAKVLKKHKAVKRPEGWPGAFMSSNPQPITQESE